MEGDGNQYCQGKSRLLLVGRIFQSHSGSKCLPYWSQKELYGFALKNKVSYLLLRKWSVWNKLRISEWGNIRTEGNIWLKLYHREQSCHGNQKNSKCYAKQVLWTASMSGRCWRAPERLMRTYLRKTPLFCYWKCIWKLGDFPCSCVITDNIYSWVIICSLNHLFTHYYWPRIDLNDSCFRGAQGSSGIKNWTIMCHNLLCLFKT